jgi:hypothetical protein
MPRMKGVQYDNDADGKAPGPWKTEYGRMWWRPLVPDPAITWKHDDSKSVALIP